MNISIELTPEQEAALTRSNASANPDESARPKLETFILDALNAKLNEHVAAWKSRDLSAISTNLEKLNDADLAEVAVLVGNKITASSGEGTDIKP